MVENFLNRYITNNDNPPDVKNPYTLVQHYNRIWNGDKPDMMYKMNKKDLEMGIGITHVQVEKEKLTTDPTIQKLKEIISTLPG